MPVVASRKNRTTVRLVTTWDPATYDEAWTRMAAAGIDPHGEVAFLTRLMLRRELSPSISILDAGCGTGRVAVELHGRGYRVEGTDVDADMLCEAMSKAPELQWTLADLAHLALGRTFDLVLLAGNVILFVDPSDRPFVAPSLRSHLCDGGLVVAGMQLAREDGRRVAVEQWDEWMRAAGFALVERFSTWDEEAWSDTADYVVSVHRALLK
jgi:SAM-dependent methyltransferase